MSSFMEIQLFQDVPYVAGQPLQGAIYLHASSNLNNVSEIRLTLKGNEQILCQPGSNKKLGADLKAMGGTE